MVLPRGLAGLRGCCAQLDLQHGSLFASEFGVFANPKGHEIKELTGFARSQMWTFRAVNLDSPAKLKGILLGRGARQSQSDNKLSPKKRGRI